MSSISQSYTTSGILRTGGAFTAVFSLVMSLLILYVIPIACSFVGSLQLLLLGLLFIGGIVVLLVGQIMVWRRKKSRVIR